MDYPNAVWDVRGQEWAGAIYLRKKGQEMLKLQTVVLVIVAFLLGQVWPSGNAAGEDQTRVQAGVLTCDVEGGISYVFGSTRALRCVFDPAGDAPKHRYVGEIKRFGLDLGVTGKTVMGWAVLAPTKSLAPEALVGDYAGVAADASLGLGAGAKILVGGSNDTISLQPLSIQGQTGVNLALTVAALELRPAR